MKIEILGTGCNNCQNLEKNTITALEQLGMDVPIEKVTDYAEIVSYGVMSTPALAVDGEVKIVGKVPPAAEIAEVLSAAV